MTNYIKKLLALAVVAGAMTAMATAPEPLAMWSDFSSLIGDEGGTIAAGEYTLTVPAGCTVGADGALVIGSQGAPSIDYTDSTSRTVTVEVEMSDCNDEPEATLITVVLAGANEGACVSSSGGVLSQRWGSTWGEFYNTGDWNPAKHQVVSFTYSGINSTDAARGSQTYVNGAPAINQHTGMISTRNGITGIRIGCKTGTEKLATGMKIHAIRIYSSRLSTAEVAEAYAAYKPLVLNNVLKVNLQSNTSPEVANWDNYTQTGNASFGPLPSADAPVNFSVSCGGGNFKGEFSRVSELDFSDNGTYVDLSGKAHKTLQEEIAASFGLESFTADIYNTGLAQGARGDATARISGLEGGTKYYVYIGTGKNSNDLSSGVTINESGIGEVERLEYVATDPSEAGHTVAVSEYTAFDLNTTIYQAKDGLLVVRLVGVTPTANGEISFGLNGERSTINFILVGTESNYVEPEPSDMAVSFTPANSVDWAGKTLPTIARTLRTKNNVGFAGDDAFLRTLGSDTATVAQVTNAVAGSKLYGLKALTGDDQGIGPITRDIYLKVSGGTPGVISGGEDAIYNGTKTVLTGDTLINIAGDTIVDYVYGAGLGGGQGVTTTGDIGIVIEGNAQVKGTVAAGWQSRHNSIPKVEGNTSVLIKNVQTHAADATLGGNPNCEQGWIVGGGIFKTNGGRSLVTGNSSVAVQLDASASGTFNKHLVGGGLGIGGGDGNNVTGNGSVTITAPASVTFAKNIIGGGHAVNGGYARIGGNTTVTINGGFYNGTIYAGGDHANATVGGTATATLTGGTFAGSIKGGTATGTKTLTITEDITLRANNNEVSGFDTVTVTEGKKVYLTAETEATLTLAQTFGTSVVKTGAALMHLRGVPADSTDVFIVEAGTLDVGTARVKADVKDGAKIHVIATDAEIAAGGLTLPVVDGAGEASVEKLELFDEQGIQLPLTADMFHYDPVAKTITITLTALPSVTNEEKTLSSLGISATASGTVIVSGTTETPAKLTLDAALPTNVSLKLEGVVTIALSGAAYTAIPLNKLTIADGATVTFEGALSTALTVASGRTITIRNAALNQPVSVAAGGHLVIDGAVSTTEMITTTGDHNSTLTINPGATLKFDGVDAPFGTGRIGGMFNIYGTLDLGSGSWKNNYYSGDAFSCEIKLFVGSTIIGTDSACLSRDGGAPITYFIKDVPGVSEKFATLNVPLMPGPDYPNQDTFFSFDEGTGLKITKANNRPEANNKLTGTNISYLELPGGSYTLTEGSSVNGVVKVPEGKTLRLEGLADTSTVYKEGAGTLKMVYQRPIMDVREGNVTMVVTQSEFAAGKIVLNIPENASEGDASKIVIYDSDEATATTLSLAKAPEVDNVNHTVTLTLGINAAITTSGNISELAAGMSGVVYVIGEDDEDPIWINFDSIPAAVTQVIIKGTVDIRGTLTNKVSFDTGAVAVIRTEMLIGDLGGITPPTIRVDEGGVFDINGTMDRTLPIVLNGGTLKNGGNAVGLGKKQWWTITLTADSFVETNTEFGMIANNHGAINFQTNGHKLTKKGTGNFIFAHVTFKNGTAAGGAIEVLEGSVELAKETTITTANVPLTGTGTVRLSGGSSVDLGTVSNVTLHFETTQETGTLKWVGNKANAICTNDSLENPFIKVNPNTTFNIYGHDYSGWLGDIRDTGWVVNNGTLVFQNDGESRFWREHIVIGNGAVTKIDHGDRNLLLYGGAGSVDAAQIMLPTGAATISAGVAGAKAAIYMGNDGQGGYGGKGAGVSVGEDATLTIDVPVTTTEDAITKWGPGTLFFKKPMTGFNVENRLVLMDGAIMIAPECGAVTVTVGAEGKELKETTDAAGNKIYKLSVNAITEDVKASELNYPAGVNTLYVEGGDDCDHPVTVTFDASLPEGKKLSIVKHVDLKVEGAITTLPMDRIGLEAGACVRLFAPIQPVGEVATLSIPAGATVKTEVNQDIRLTNNGGSFIIENNSTATVTASSGGAIKGLVEIAAGSTYVNMTTDAITKSENVTVNVYGTLNMNGRHWTLEGNGAKLVLFGGAHVIGTGTTIGRVFDIRREGDAIDARVGATNAPAVIDGCIGIITASANISIEAGALLELPGGLLGREVDSPKVSRKGNGHLSGVIPLTGPLTLDYGTGVSNVPARFVATSGTVKLHIGGTNGSDAPLCADDTKASPFLKVNSGAELHLDGNNYSGSLGALLDSGYIVNEGTLAFQAGGGLRFFRQPLVLGNGSTTKINSGTYPLMLYGGTGDGNAAQISLPSGTASIVVGETNGGANGKLSIGRTGGNDYGDKGAAIFVGAGAKLSIETPIDGPDSLVKKGAGILNVGATREKKIAIDAGTIEFTATSDELIAGELSFVASEEGEAGELDPTAIPYRVVNGGGEKIEITEASREGDRITLSWQVKLGRALTDFVDITASGTETLTDFPVLVRLSEKTIPGFTYDRAGSDGSKIRFYQLRDTADYNVADTSRDVSRDIELPFEIVDWNPEGESLVWVKINSSKINANAKGKFRMYWHAIDELKAAPKTTQVWSAYAGVWHMDEEIFTANAAATASKDSTENKLHATPRMGRPGGTATVDGNMSQMVSVPGVLGLARVNASSRQNNGNYLEIPSYDELGLGGNFAFSCWVKLTETGRFPQLACRKSLTSNAMPGWHIELNGGNYGQEMRNVMTVRGSAAQNISRTVFSAPHPEDLDEFTFLTVVFNGTTATIYSNGTKIGASDSIGTAAADNGLPLTLGLGHFGNTSFSGNDYPSLQAQYDEVRLHKGSVDTAWVNAEYNTIMNPDFCTFGLVNRPVDEDPTERKWIDYWTQEPTLKHYWNANELTAEIVNASAAASALRSGRRIAASVKTVEGAEATLPLADIGLYTVVYAAASEDPGPQGAIYDYFDGPRRFEVEVVESRADPVIDPAGATESGRVLLANDDPRQPGEVIGQEYDAPGWEHDDLASTLTEAALRIGRNHTFTNSEGRVLWKLDSVYLGNIVLPGYNTLPYSTTATSNTSLFLRNLTGAAINSNIYTNGIGTIYFDAVNVSTNAPGEKLALVVEVTDAELDADPDETTWRRLEVTPVKITGATLAGTGATLVKEAATNRIECLNLSCASATTFDYYRFYAPVNEKKPLRFRIMRDASRPSELDNSEEDPAGWIAIDNIVASYAPVLPELEPAGKYDATRAGAATLGVETAFTCEGGANYPTPTDTLKGHVYVVGGNAEDLGSVRLRYRWRYLNARFEPALTREGTPVWKTAFFDLSDKASGEYFTDALELPPLAGDLEYYYDITATVPFYDYIDYATATGVAADPVAGYSEEPGRDKPIEIRAEQTLKPSGGRDWFVRLREWTSATRGYRLFVKKDGAEDGAAKTFDMSFVSEGTWRGVVKSNESAGFGEGTLAYRIEREVPTNPGARAEDFKLEKTCYRGNLDAESTPISLALIEGTTNNWSTIVNNDSTGYLMFQLDERTQSLTILRADYQNFNAWHDAHSDDAKFVGTSTDNGAKSGVSSKMRAYLEKFQSWTDSMSTDTLWCEDFSNEAIAVLDKPFTEARTRGERGWIAENGMWVAQKYKDAEHEGKALQLEGQGLGRLTAGGYDIDPRGLESVSYSARLADAVDFNRVAWDYASLTPGNNGYTFISQVVMSDTFAGEPWTFDGAGTVSLFANYLPGRGAYEFRILRVQSGRLEMQLYKWTSPSEEPTLLHSDGANVPDSYFRKSGTVGQPTYPTAYISVAPEYNAQNKVVSMRIQVGMCRTAVSAGVNPDQNCMGLTYWDKTNPLQLGAYGVAAANCTAKFDQPRCFDAPVVWQGGTDEKKVLSNAPVVWQGTCDNAKSSLEDGRWAMDGERVAYFTDTTVSPNRWGIAVKPVEQKLFFEYLAPTVKGQPEPHWTAIATNTVSTYMTTPYETFLYRPVRGSYRITHGGARADERVDVVIDDIVLRQWGGAEFGDFDTLEWVRGNASAGYPTNFVFTSGWVNNHTLELSAKRTLPGTPCSLRTPLMDGEDGRGLGLGVMTVGYRNADPDLILHFQIATNNVIGGVRAETASLDTNIWTTVRTIKFSQMSEDERENGVLSLYLGCHGVPGVARILVEPSLAEAAAKSNNPKFGSIEIVSAFCRDEPVLDDMSWWGWNIRTFGLDELTRWDTGSRSYLSDFGTPESPESLGLSLALNNSATVDTRVETEAAVYTMRMPFVQTPSFKVDGGSVGSISFRARMFALGDDDQKAEVRLYGTTSTEPDAPAEMWQELDGGHFVISNTVYTTYSYRAKGEDTKYNAFRLGVTGVSEVNPGARGPAPTEGETPVRVMIDEIVVTESIFPKMGFKYVYPVRTNLESNEVSPVYLEDEGRANFREQPLLGENWTIQTEIMTKRLPDEIDLTREPEVTISWYEGEEPWGYNQWKNLKGAKTAKLERAEGESMVYRGSFKVASDAVADASEESLYAVVQYTAHVTYYSPTGESYTSELESGEWVKPYWYDPVDHNKGKNVFSAFTILETISPRCAWINEANIYDGSKNYTGLAETNQYVEIAFPAVQSLEGWKLWYIDNSEVTNRLVTFGAEAPAEKLDAITNDYAFMVVQSPKTRDAKMWDNIDGTWRNFDNNGGKLQDDLPIELRLVRPSGIVEQSIALEGYNSWSGGRYEKDFNLDAYVAKRNANKLNHTYAVGSERDNPLVTGLKGLSVNVIEKNGATSNEWSVVKHQTPGWVNEDQIIPEDWAILPAGSKIVITARVTDEHVKQTFGDRVDSTEAVKVTIPKGGEGTNITYTVDTWYEMAGITTNAVPLAGIAGKKGSFTILVGKGCSNSVTVVASTLTREDLRVDYGLTKENRYTPAVMDWLNEGKNYYGEEFENPGEIKFAHYIDASGVDQGALSLTDMYWLDIDPTSGKWNLHGGVTNVGTKNNNFVVTLKLEISDDSEADEAQRRKYAPYVLRGEHDGKGVTSIGYDAEEYGNWNSATFKVMGSLQKSATEWTDYLPLRMFYFKPESFDENHQAVIEIRDPRSVNYGPQGWEKYPSAQIFYKWAIDERNNRPIAVETLRPDSTF